MRNQTTITAALLAGALIAPASAQADVSKGVEAVAAYTTRADKALDRAVELYATGAAKRADRTFRESRRAMSAAVREAARLRRGADVPAEHAAAARALRLVATEQDENVEKLTAALEGAEGASERLVAAAAQADVRARDKALKTLGALLDEVPEQARAELTRAIAALSTGREDEIEAQAKALTSDEIAPQAKQTVARTLKADVAGQASAAQTLAALIADEDVPDDAKAGLRKAYDAVTAEHASVADALARASERMPERVRAVVGAIAADAREDAQGLRQNRPGAPSSDEGSVPGEDERGSSPEEPEGAPQDPPAGEPQDPSARQPQAPPARQPQAPPVGRP